MVYSANAKEGDELAALISVSQICDLMNHHCSPICPQDFNPLCVSTERTTFFS